MTKKELARELAERERFSIDKSNQIVNDVFEIIGSCLKKGESVKIRRFGTFCVGKRNAKDFVNPMTKERSNLPPQKYPMFIVSKVLKRQVRNEDV